jgi:hypothetical protein
MSISVCVQGLVDEGKINKGDAAEAERLYNFHYHTLKGQMGSSAAATLASERAIAAMKAQLVRKKYVAGLAVKARQRIAGELDSYNGGAAARDGKPIDPRAGVALFGGDDRAEYSNLEGRKGAIEARMFAGMNKLLEKFSSGTLGRARNKAELENVGREAFGTNTGDESAKELASAWLQSAEYGRQRFNAAGGDIGKMENWGLPVIHDSRAVRKGGFDAWAKAINANADRAKMIDRRTGQPFTDDAWNAMLKEEFAKIRSEGWSHREPGSAAGPGSLANQRSEERFFQWKDYDHWKAYNDEFGKGNAYDAMVGHVRGMAHDIAQLEILGPNPEATIKWLKDTITKSAEMDPTPDSKAPDRAHSAVKKIDRIMDEFTGAARRPENRTLAAVGSAVRSWQTAAKLGGAFLSTPSDAAFQFSTRKFNGLPAAKMLPQYLKLMTSRGSQTELARAGLIAQRWLSHTGGQSRHLGEELTGEFSKRLAEGVIRSSGLARITDAGRMAFGESMLGAITDNSVKTWDKLDPAFQRMFERNGIREPQWDALRKTPLEMMGGVPWILPTNVEDHALGDRVLEMIDRETRFAVPEPDLATKAMMSRPGAPGTVAGELFKSAALFKAFGVAATAMQAHRIAVRAASSKAGAARYAAGLGIGTTLMGALSLMLKDAITSGQDPRAAGATPFTDPKTGELTLNPGFWGAAAAQGGGAGALGDLLKSSQGRAGNLAETVAGPVVGDVGRLAVLPNSTNPAGDALRLARSELPGGSLWYTRLAFDRMLADQIQEEIDPHYARSWRRMEKGARDKGTEFYWHPGDMLPERAPDLSNIRKGDR